MAVRVPQINNGKRPEEPLLAHVHLLPLPSDTPYGNLTLRSMKIVMRIDWLFALALKYNRLDKSPQFHSVALSDVVQQFSGFYERAVGSVGQLSSRVKAGRAANRSGAV
jgi:hypothetical protein